MEDKAEITPLPWHIGTIHAQVGCDVFGNDNTLVAACGTIIHQDHAKDNTAYIVKACNNFPKLVEVLNKLVTTLDECGYDDTFFAGTAEAKAVLASVEEILK